MVNFYQITRRRITENNILINFYCPAPEVRYPCQSEVRQTDVLLQRFPFEFILVL